MPPSSDSISSTSLPFGIDNHIHASLRRSGSLPHSLHHEYQSAIYNQGPQKYSGLIIDSRASDAVSCRSNAQIPPSSIHNIPRSHKKVLRRHRKLFWVLIGFFNISLIALTAAVVLGAMKAHENGQNGAKSAAIILGVFGFCGMVGSAAVIWLIVTGRRARARLERRWADEEKVKEARGVRERERESHMRESIRDRERSLSRSRSRGRDRGPITRPAIAKKASFRAMTISDASSSQRPDHHSRSRRRNSAWLRPVGVSHGIHDPLDDGSDEQASKEKDGENGEGQNGDGKEDEGTGGRDTEDKAQATQLRTDSTTTSFLDLDTSDSEDDDDDSHTLETPSPQKTAAFRQKTPQSDDPNIYPALPTRHASPSPLNTTSTYLNSSPTDPYPSTPSTHTAQSNRFNSENPPHDTIPIPRLRHGGLGSAQSDENFRAMLEVEGDLGSEDEAERRARRERVVGRVEEWRSRDSLRGEVGEREERRRRVRVMVERGVRRVRERKRGWREAVAVAVVGGREGGA